MSTESIGERSQPGVDWRRAEFVLGAKAVWEGRIQAAEHGFPGGPGAGEPGLFSPSGNGAPSRRPSR